MTGLLAEVRIGAARVAARARSVRVVVDRVPAYAAELAEGGFALPTLDPEAHHLGRGDETAAFFLTLATVNFGSGTFPEIDLGGLPSGYFLVAGGLARRFREAGVPAAAELRGIGPEACLELFDLPESSPAARDLAARYATALAGLGSWLEERFAGDSTAVLEAAGGSAESLVGLLTEMPLFDDRWQHGGESVAFLKRAQLAAADLSLAFGGEGPGRFDDLDRLTVFADDLVPHVLRTDGVLAYAPDLARRVDAGDPLAAGCAEEVEIRAGAIHAAELVVAELRRMGMKVDARRLDYRLWNRGLGDRYRQGRAHRCVGFAY